MLQPPPYSVGVVTALRLDDDERPLPPPPPQNEGVWLDGSRHCVFNVSDISVVLDEVEQRQSVYAYGCRRVTLDIGAKVNNITLDKCDECTLRYHSCISLLEVVHCRDISLVSTGPGTETLQCDMSVNVTSEGVSQPRNLVHSNNVRILLGDYTVPASAFTEQRWTYLSQSTGEWATRSTHDLRDAGGHGIVVLKQSH